MTIRLRISQSSCETRKWAKTKCQQCRVFLLLIKKYNISLPALDLKLIHIGGTDNRPSFPLLSAFLHRANWAWAIANISTITAGQNEGDGRWMLRMFRRKGLAWKPPRLLWRSKLYCRRSSGLLWNRDRAYWRECSAFLVLSAMSTKFLEISRWWKTFMSSSCCATLENFEASGSSPLLFINI